MTSYTIPSTGGSNWNLIADDTRLVGTPESRGLGFNLGVKTRTKFLAISVTSSNQKPTWVSAGYLSQLYSIPRFTVVPSPQYVALNRINLLPMPNLADFEYELVFDPLKYFDDVTIKVWEYAGQVTSPQQSEVIDFAPVLEQINQLDAGIYTLAEGIADLLPSDRGSQIKQNAGNRLQLDFGFL